MYEQTATDHSLRALAEAFRTPTLEKGDWTHVAQLRVGAWYVFELGEVRALAALRDGIRRLNESHGVANTESGGYHETITVAYVRLIGAYLATFDDTVPLEARVTALVNGPLADRELTFRYWSRERLLSNRARLEWVEPDLRPLAAEDVEKDS